MTVPDHASPARWADGAPEAFSEVLEDVLAAASWFDDRRRGVSTTTSGGVTPGHRREAGSGVASPPRTGRTLVTRRNGR